MRQVVLDTETTGLDPKSGHRIIEIGAVELNNRQFTHNQFHCYINPGREIDKEAISIHGIDNKFLLDKPNFSEIVDGLINFISGADLVIHNAPFDVGFLNHEFSLLDPKLKAVKKYVNSVFDTLEYARRKHPGKKNNLDALCQRYKVDNKERKLHGALLDAWLLAKVYLAMTSGQTTMFGDLTSENSKDILVNRAQYAAGKFTVTFAAKDEIEKHKDFLALLKKKSGKCLWDEN